MHPFKIQLNKRRIIVQPYTSINLFAKIFAGDFNLNLQCQYLRYRLFEGKISNNLHSDFIAEIFANLLSSIIKTSSYLPILSNKPFYICTEQFFNRETHGSDLK